MSFLNKILIFLYFMASSSKGFERHGPDFPRKKTADHNEIFLSSNQSTPSKIDLHEKESQIHPPWYSADSNSMEIRTCSNMNMCLEMYYVDSMLCSKSQNELEASIKYILSEGENDLPFEMDVIDIKVSEHMIQGRRIRKLLENENAQLYPLLVCFTMTAEYQFKKELNCENILIDFLNYYHESFIKEVMEDVKRNSQDSYFQQVDRMNIASSVNQSPLSAIAYAANQQINTASNNVPGTDTAMISFIIAAAVGLVLLAFITTMFMQNFHKKDEGNDFDVANYPPEIATAVNNTKDQAAWAYLDDFAEQDKSSITTSSQKTRTTTSSQKTPRDTRGERFSNKRHPWSTPLEDSKQPEVSNSYSNTSSPLISERKSAVISPLSQHRKTAREVVASATYPLKVDMGRSLSEKTSPTKQKESIAKAPKEDIFREGVRGECFAPPGKLGVAIDSMDGVPVVHRVKSGSPLEGILYHLDRIVAIDEVDTSSLSAAEVTKLMVSRMNKTRKITYIRSKFSHT